MRRLTLHRTGLPPLAFDGRLVADASGKFTGDRTNVRWHDISVYRTLSGRYVLQIGYNSTWRDEPGWHDAYDLGDSAELVRKLADYDPTRYVRGYPMETRYQERQARLKADIRERFLRQVDEVMGQCPELVQVIA